MKKFTPFLFFSALVINPSRLWAQLNHFIYLQTENRQPFYVKLDKKVLSSSATGYLIIPKLKDGTYSLAVGFPKSEAAEQKFECSIHDKDAGFLIKNFGGRGWGLFNLQTLDVLIAVNETSKIETARIEKTDSFSTMLSQVVDDPSIKQVDKPKEEPKIIQQKTEQAVQVENTNGTMPVKAMPEEKPVVPAEKIGKPAAVQKTIVRKQVVTGNTGTGMLYIDMTGGKPDTIRIFIPSENVGVANKTGDVSLEKPSNPVIVDKPKGDAPDSQAPTLTQENTSANNDIQETGATTKSQPESDKKFLPIDVPVSKATDTSATLPSNAGNAPMVNSDCRSYAAEEDFLKLRKKMAAEQEDEKMIAIAKKAFKSKCYTTEQVKNLCVLFLNDAGKYIFFDLAYQYVSDSHNFSSLEKLLSEPYYISRFRAMVQH